MKKRIEAGQAPKWHPHVIRQLLANRAVMGHFQPHKLVDGKRVKDGPELEHFYPAVINEGLFARVMAATATRKTVKGERSAAGRKDDYANLFSGLCRCEVCKKGVVMRHQKGKAYLVCEMARHGSCTNRRYFPYARLEGVILNLVGVGVGQMLESLIPKTDQESESPIPALEDRLAGLRMNRKRLVERFGEGDDEAAELADRLAGQIRDVERELIEARDADLMARHAGNESLMMRLQAAKAKLASGDLDARAEMAQLLRQRVQSVVLTKDKHIVVTFTNGRRNSPTVKVDITTEGVWEIIRN
jgi:hypothetical protein